MLSLLYHDIGQLALANMFSDMAPISRDMRKECVSILSADAHKFYRVDN